MNTTFQYPHQIVRHLGLKCFAVYALMQWAEHQGLIPITRNWLIDNMPYNTSPSTITDALRFLTNPENQLAARVSGGWRLTDGFQPPLPYDENSQMSSEQTFGVSTITTTIMKGQKNLDGAVVVIDPKSPQSRHLDLVYQTQGVTFEKNLRACQLVGIGQPKANEISKLEWAEPDFIKAHVNDLAEGETIGMAIRRIESNEIPSSWVKQAHEIAQRYKPKRGNNKAVTA